jgi:hypothetical protein
MSKNLFHYSGNRQKSERLLPLKNKFLAASIRILNFEHQADRLAIAPLMVEFARADHENLMNLSRTAPESPVQKSDASDYYPPR